MPEISSQVQAVFHAFNSEFDWIEDGVPGPQYKAIAAALRAAVNQADPKRHIENIVYQHQSYVDGWKDCIETVLAIADGLEAQ
jgi:hypothetical protein